MNNNGILIMLPVESLKPHPENPRKDLGDLSELTESIKAQGVLQNLTVVPDKDGVYKIIIGHRRFAAAKAAGLEELPCVIADMNEKEQLATMLMENMQRADLTVYEQAKAFQQLSLDLGMPIKEISRKSGFSETTIRKRTKLAKLDESEFKAACDRGATLFDFEALDKIKDPNLKKRCLKAMGTSNFRNEIKSARDEERERVILEKLKKDVSEFATEIKKTTYDYQNGYYKTNVGGEDIKLCYGRRFVAYEPLKKIDKPEDADNVRYFYMESARTIDLYREDVKTSEQQEEERIQKEYRIKVDSDEAQMKAIQARHKELRQEFILNYPAAKTSTTTAAKYLLRALVWLNGVYFNCKQRELCELLKITYDKEHDAPDKKEYERMQTEQPERLLLITTFWHINRDPNYARRQWKYLKGDVIVKKENKALDMLYEFLEALGYEKSDEERQLADGTHPLFYKPEKAEE